MLQKKLKTGNMMKFIGYMRKGYEGLTWERREKENVDDVLYVMQLPSIKTTVKVEVLNTGSIVHIPTEFYHFDMRAYQKLENYINEYFK